MLGSKSEIIPPLALEPFRRGVALGGKVVSRRRRGFSFSSVSASVFQHAGEATSDTKKEIRTKESSRHVRGILHFIFKENKVSYCAATVFSLNTSSIYTRYLNDDRLKGSFLNSNVDIDEIHCTQRRGLRGNKHS